MRIVQTFWTARADLTRSTFGWLHPEYNLMSWALSYLSLREHYDEVALSLMATKGMREIQIQMIQ